MATGVVLDGERSFVVPIGRGMSGIGNLPMYGLKGAEGKIRIESRFAKPVYTSDAEITSVRIYWDKLGPDEKTSGNLSLSGLKAPLQVQDGGAGNWTSITILFGMYVPSHLRPISAN